MKMSQVTRIIYEDWGGDPQSKVCEKIVDYLVQNKTASHLTYGILRRILGDGFTEFEILDSVQYLCGARVNLLQPGFEFIDDSGIYPINTSELREAEKHGNLVHPFSGELVTDYKNNVCIYFEPSELVKDISLE